MRWFYVFVGMMRGNEDDDYNDNKRFFYFLVKVIFFVWFFVGFVVGNRICVYFDVRKFGFIGSIEIGKLIMERYLWMCIYVFICYLILVCFFLLFWLYLLWFCFWLRYRVIYVICVFFVNIED